MTEQAFDSRPDGPYGQIIFVGGLDHTAVEGFICGGAVSWPRYTPLFASYPKMQGECLIIVTPHGRGNIQEAAGHHQIEDFVASFLILTGRADQVDCRGYMIRDRHAEPFRDSCR